MGTSLIKPYGDVLQAAELPDLERQRLLIEQAVRLPTLTLSSRQVCDLELLATGAFSPLNTFMDQTDYAGVLGSMRLANGLLFPIPIVLSVPAAFPTPLDHPIALRDHRNELLAILTVTNRYHRDRVSECQSIAGTQDTAHPLVRELAQSEIDLVSGPLQVIRLPRHIDHPDLRLTPLQVRARLAELGHPNVVAFQTRNPMHRAHEEMVRRAAAKIQGSLLLHPVVGPTQPGDVDVQIRVKCYRALMTRYFSPNTTLLSIVPLAMRMAGPKEALWHALIRRNFGASALIVGRDHAGPGRDSRGRPFYAPDAAQELACAHQDELGVRILPFEELGYQPLSNRYVPLQETTGGPILTLSGSEARRLLSSPTGPLPNWLVRPEVDAILQTAAVPRHRQGFCVWFTGLPGAGKSTLAAFLTDWLSAHGRVVTLLDGDTIRKTLSSELGFSRADRDTNVLRIGYVASEIVRHQGAAVCAVVSPFAAARDKIRSEIGPDRFLLVYVNTPLETCERRDPKGLYRQAHSGELSGLTGVGDPYEPPSNADLVLSTASTEPDELLHQIVMLLKHRGLILGSSGL
jgi:sulfate adenylyltransferase